MIANTRHHKLSTLIKPKSPIPRTEASTTGNKSHPAVSELRLYIGHMTQWDSNINTKKVYSIVDVSLVHNNHAQKKKKAEAEYRQKFL